MSWCDEERCVVVMRLCDGVLSCKGFGMVQGMPTLVAKLLLEVQGVRLVPEVRMVLV